MLTHFDTQVQCEEYYGEEPYVDEAEMPDTQELDTIEGDGEFDECELIDNNGGITADGFALLAEMDAQGYFV